MHDTFTIDRRGLLLGAGTLALASSLPLKARAQSPRKGGTLRIGMADFSTSETLDPTLMDSQFQQNLHWQLRNNLIEVGPGGVLIPELAESWKGSKDAKTWTFSLRKGVTFHNGKPFTADDVIYSFNLHLKEGSKSQARPLLAQVASMKADGPNTVIFDLKDANVGFPAITSAVGLYIVPNGETDFDKGVGTGGYILEHFQPGVKSVVRRNPNYWKADRAHFDTVEMICMKDATARANALLTGQIDAYNSVDAKTVSLLQRSNAIRINRVKSKAHFAFPMMVDQGPFTSNDVRLAMKLAIDREDIVKRILNGFGSVGNDHPLSPAYQMYSADVPQRSYDPDRAKFHLKKAGVSDLKVQLHVSDTPFTGATDAAVLYKAHAAKAGITIDVVKEPEDGYWSSVWSKKPFCATRWSGRVNEDVIFSLVYTADGIKAGWNETRLNDDRVNRLVEEARREFDTEKRRALYAELQRIVHDDGGSNIFAFSDFIDAVSSKVTHGELSGEYMLDGSRAAERWWFA
ncbi:ABC transporter substrate-binding protein [Microvirga sp. TS319]|uniref:ABC transporter substrate-binding protein n=1 Tax=Microvirga sp. TS319 TaxID=3241165 RepID=UPI00351AA8DC